MTEQEVLGACIIDPDALVTTMEYLGPQSFSNHRHRIIYEAMLSLDAEGTPVEGQLSLFCKEGGCK